MTDSTTLTDGSPVTDDHKELKTNGQQKGYVVLSEEERAKGFVRPVRTGYVHVGPPEPLYPLHDITDTQKKLFGEMGYVKFEKYPEDRPGSATGRYWSQKDLDKVGKGCGTRTEMGTALAETYAREPGFYGGTFCCGCQTHLPVKEFLWDGTDERVGS